MLAFGEDRWFEITDDTETLATTIVDLLDRVGLDFFQKFQSYGDVLSYYHAHGDFPFQNAGRASLEAALVANHTGAQSLSAALFTKAYATNHRGFQQHVAELAKRIGHSIG